MSCARNSQSRRCREGRHRVVQRPFRSPVAEGGRAGRMTPGSAVGKKWRTVGRAPPQLVWLFT
eukprot:scaffold220197_cov24-Tisochrysis_lutea.AAC.2